MTLVRIRLNAIKEKKKKKGETALRGGLREGWEEIQKWKVRTGGHGGSKNEKIRMADEKNTLQAYSKRTKGKKWMLCEFLSPYWWLY